MTRKKDEYSEIYEGYAGDNGDDREFDYSDLSGYEPEFDEEEAIEKARGEVDVGPCMYCDGEMENDGSLFVCTSCGMTASENEYLRWYVDNVADYDDIYK